MTHRLATDHAKNYCNRTLIVKVIVENVVTCFGDTVYTALQDCQCSVCHTVLIKHYLLTYLIAKTKL